MESRYSALARKFFVPSECKSYLLKLCSALFNDSGLKLLTVILFRERVYCPANCSGRGECKHGTVNGCNCFDPADDSPMCSNSPVLRPSPTPVPSQTPSVNKIPSSFPSQSKSNVPTTSPTISFYPSSKPNHQSTHTPTISPSLQTTTTTTTTRTETSKPSKPTILESNFNASSLQSKVSTWHFLSVAFLAVSMHML